MISPSSPWFTSYGAGTDGRNDDLFRANFFPLHSSAILTLYHKDHARDSARSTKAASIKPLIELLSREEEESLGLGFLSVLCFVVIQRFERQRFPPFLHLHLSFSGQKGRQITSFPSRDTRGRDRGALEERAWKIEIYSLFLFFFNFSDAWFPAEFS